MKPNRRRQIIVETLRTETQHDDKFSKCTKASPGKVGVARIRSANMSTEGTPRAKWITLISKLILLNSVWIHAGNRFGTDRHQRIACSRAADHFRTQLLSLPKISASLVVKKLPQTS